MRRQGAYGEAAACAPPVLALPSPSAATTTDLLPRAPRARRGPLPTNDGRLEKLMRGVDPDATGESEFEDDGSSAAMDASDADGADGSLEGSAQYI